MSNYGSVTRTQYDAPANGFVLNPFTMARRLLLRRRSSRSGFCRHIRERRSKLLTVFEEHVDFEDIPGGVIGAHCPGQVCGPVSESSWAFQRIWSFEPSRLLEPNVQRKNKK